MTGEEALAELERLNPGRYVAAAITELWTNSEMGHRAEYKVFVMIDGVICQYDGDSFKEAIGELLVVPMRTRAGGHFKE